MNGDMCLVNWMQANLSFSDWCDNKITLFMNMGYSGHRGTANTDTAQAYGLQHIVCPVLDCFGHRPSAAASMERHKGKEGLVRTMCSLATEACCSVDGML